MNPDCSGAPATITIGMVFVAAIAALTAGVKWATIIATHPKAAALVRHSKFGDQYQQRVKTRICLFRAYVSFHRLSTCLHSRVFIISWLAPMPHAPALSTAAPSQRSPGEPRRGCLQKTAPDRDCDRGPAPPAKRIEKWPAA